VITMTGRQLSAWVPSIHPFRADGELDEAAFRGHIQRLATLGMHIFVANEGTGESHTMNFSEMRRVMEIAKEEAEGHVPVCGMGRKVRTASEMIEFVRAVEETGLDGIHIYGLDIGHGLTPSPREQEAYLDEVLSSTTLPIMISCWEPSGYLYSLPLLERIVARYEHVTSIMLAAFNMNYAQRLIDSLGGRVEIITAPAILLPGLAFGSNGFALSIGNLVPRTCVSIVDHYRAGRYPEAEVAFAAMQRISGAIADFGGAPGSSSVIKAALNILGLSGGYPRKPRLPLEDERLPILAELIERLDIRVLEGLS
jgi:4-hydroxy-tetrahydrodipicolinate synthase